MANRVEINRIKISSWAAPTAEDIAMLGSLSESQRAELISREVQKGVDSGLSDKTMNDVWKEALRRAEPIDCSHFR